MRKRTLLNTKAFELTLKRLCFELIENHKDFENTILIALQPRGPQLLNRIVTMLQTQCAKLDLKTAELDITFYRDDFRRGRLPLKASSTKMPHIIENKNVILIDDVLFTGRSVRAGLEAIVDYGRPKKVELLALIDRRYSRHLPIQPDYVGRKVDAIASERVLVNWKETDGNDEVLLFTVTKENE
ncbi:MAG: bifunctional pyr operon transcriptional regulator/uracil phosphoribosyltransferase PyrR [Flavobacteriales bacterium]|nr:bifunctional pyr operon transcriptional regulator/uracil phosphoribosyltransferase PyrR [Flavobacteriales bacterium]